MAEEIILRAEAKKQGLSHYFTGKPCLRGHIAKRVTAKSYCVECKKFNERIRTSKPKAQAISIAYRLKNREKFKADSKKRYYENPDTYKKKAKEWAILNPELAAISARKRTSTWRARNPEKISQFDRNRRARKRQASGTHTHQDIVDIFALQKKKCAYCKSKITMNNKHVDHIIALANGGSNDRCNLQILCAKCNLRKNRKDPIDYAQSLGMLL